MTREELKQECKRLIVCYPNRFEMTQERFDIWYDLMGGLKALAVHEAVSRHMATSDYPPFPASIIRLYNEVIEEWRLIMNHVWNTYNLTCDIYQRYGGEVREEDKEIFKDYLRGTPYPDRERKAADFLHELQAYLETKDKNADDNGLPTFREYIGGKR